MCVPLLAALIRLLARKFRREGHWLDVLRTLICNYGYDGNITGAVTVYTGACHTKFIATLMPAINLAALQQPRCRWRGSCHYLTPHVWLGSTHPQSQGVGGMLLVQWCYKHVLNCLRRMKEGGHLLCDVVDRCVMQDREERRRFQRKKALF